MSNKLEIYVTLRSPYSYLASRRIVELVESVDVPVTFRPVYPIAIKNPDFFEKNDPLWLSYLIKDTLRVAEMNEIPFGWPNPDPIVQDLQTRKIAPEQPYIRRLTRLTVAAEEEGKGLDYYAKLSFLVFGSGKKWDEGSLLADAATEIGLDFDAMEAKISADPQGYDAIIEENEKAQRASGHWGTPLLVFNGEPFFGQDRIDMCLWRMKQNGVDVK
ncbi:MAG: DsbA family protein [Pseudomonadota bacterium]